jgi:hypothetical protein
VGLEGGTGAVGGAVLVDTAGRIETRGDEARGVWAQSVGGGGGAGGAATNIILRAMGSLTVGVGGAGGSGALSDTVGVDNAALILTAGAKSDGILAQSIGGGGGVGGYAATAAIQLGGVAPGATSGTASVNVGGTGGTGAESAAVTVTNTGVIGTEGAEAFGIRAQSIGGGGGIGGAAINIRAQDSRPNFSLDANVGGKGGVGGSASSVSVLNEGAIVTLGREAAGISANSIGGGGGDGGFVFDLVVGAAGASNNSYRGVLNIGGKGGSGGTGGDVSVINSDTGADYSGNIVTFGERAYGLFAQSIGGGGGNGSSIISITGLMGGTSNITAGLSLGGFGGQGDAGGDVSVLNEGLIDTSGAHAYGILAQSIGGGGGNGGMAISANLQLKSDVASPLVTVGGIGGDGGDGGDVIVDNAGQIITRGAAAHGIVAQSIGGGGGNAVMGLGMTGSARTSAISNSISAIVGMTGGGQGGVGGQVTVNHSGDITVLGDGAMGIKAESINGGGGSLTFDFSGITGLPGVPFIGADGAAVGPNPMIVARAGAEGVADSVGGRVSVDSTGTFGAAGANGVGSFQQSVGGGGGTINVNAHLSDEDGGFDDPSAPIGIRVTLGGVDGTNNAGGDVESTHGGQIVTTGDNTSGVLVQSIGGGGGRAVVDMSGPSSAMFGPAEFRLGGENGVNEAGGDVSRVQTGAVFTTGVMATGVTLQSVGGGGGSISAIFDNPAPGVVGVSTMATRMAPMAAPVGPPVNVTFGASGGAALNGGSVFGSLVGGAGTTGDHAIGVVAQSVGGGGGELRIRGAGAVHATLGGTAGASGDGGAINLENEGDILTAGFRAHGAVLQSVGGGGGLVFGDFTNPTLVLNTANSGDGGAIMFQQSGDIIVTGEGAYALIAQSLGGGGGWIDGAFAGAAGGAGRGGAIDLGIAGDIFAGGLNSTAILAQSLGADGAGDVSIAVDALVRGGSGSGAGVVIDGGATNTITTSGSISAVSGLAINTGSGDDRVVNTGLVVGNVDLGGGANAFQNQAGSTFVAFSTIDLRDGAPGAPALFTNAGDFLMGLDASAMPVDLAAGDVFGNLDGLGAPTENLLYGARVINTVALDGHFVQTATGHLAFDLAFGPYASDRVNVTGDATVDGTGQVVLTWLENDDRVTLFATGGSGYDNGLEIADTLALDYSVYANAAGVHLGFVSDFGQAFLNANGRALGGHMDRAIRDGGSGGIGRLMALIGNLQAGQEDVYSAIFTDLNPEPHLSPLRTQLASANSFPGDLFTCGASPGLDRDQCVWARVDSLSSEFEGDAEYFGAEGGASRLRMGFERPLDSEWSLAAAVGYEDIDHSVDFVRARSEGDAYNLGLGLRYVGPGGNEFALSLSGGQQSLDTRRRMTIFGDQVGLSSPSSSYMQAGLRLGRVFRGDRLFARPALNATLTALKQDGFSETGLGGLGIERLSETTVIGAFNPEVTFGAVLHDDGTTRADFVFSVGGVFYSEDRIEAPFRLLGANVDSGPAFIATALDSEAVRVGAGVDVTSGDGLSVRVGYSAEIGDRMENHTAGFNLRMRF